VTHLFAISQDSEKYDCAMEYQGITGIKVLLPHWFDDSVRLGMRGLDTQAYEWPEPSVLERPQEGETQPKPKPHSKNPEREALFSTVTYEPNNLSSTVPSRPVWEKRRILLSSTLGLSRERRDTLYHAIRQADGIPMPFSTTYGDADMSEELELLDSSDVLITQHRSGRSYFKVQFTSLFLW
jgi:mediator of DNA damage checkpoint protein 1